MGGEGLWSPGWVGNACVSFLVDQLTKLNNKNILSLRNTKTAMRLKLLGKPSKAEEAFAKSLIPLGGSRQTPGVRQELSQFP